MVLWVQCISKFKKNKNKINNLDNKNVYEYCGTDINGQIINYYYHAYFWGLRRYKDNTINDLKKKKLNFEQLKKMCTEKNHSVNITNIKDLRRYIKNNGIHKAYIENKSFKNLYDSLKIKKNLKNYLLLGDKKSGFDLYKVNGKFLNNNQNLFDDVFYFTFSLEKTNHHISHINLKKLMKPYLDKKGKKNFSSQSITNWTKLYNIDGHELINYINNINNIPNNNDEIEIIKKETDKYFSFENYGHNPFKKDGDQLSKEYKVLLTGDKTINEIIDFCKLNNIRCFCRGGKKGSRYYIKTEKNIQNIYNKIKEIKLTKKIPFGMHPNHITYFIKDDISETSSETVSDEQQHDTILCDFCSKDADMSDGDENTCFSCQDFIDNH
jgi:hypothetical protein